MSICLELRWAVSHKVSAYSWQNIKAINVKVQRLWLSSPGWEKSMIDQSSQDCLFEYWCWSLWAVNILGTNITTSGHCKNLSLFTSWFPILLGEHYPKLCTVLTYPFAVGRFEAFSQRPFVTATEAHGYLIRKLRRPTKLSVCKLSVLFLKIHGQDKFRSLFTM